VLRRALAVVACLLSLTAAPTHAGPHDVTASRNDDARTGAMLGETLLNEDTVSQARHPHGFGRLFDYDLTTIGGKPAGEIYAQPLYLGNISVAGHGVVNMLVVATMGNLIAALDADGPPPGRDGVLWTRDLGAPADMQSVVWRNCSATDNCRAPIGNNIRGVAGVGSTPVVDRQRGILFIVNREHTGPDIEVAYRIHALDVRNGHELPGSPETIRGSHLGATFNANWQNQRVGLATSGGQVIVGFGAYEDLLPYRGWVFSYRYDDGIGFVRTAAMTTTPDGDTSKECAAVKPTPARVGAQVALGLATAKLLLDIFFDPAMIPFDIVAVATAEAAFELASIDPEIKAANSCAHGGLWMTGRAPAIDPGGRVLLMVGNGRNDLGLAPNRNFGNSLLALDPQTLGVLDSFTPSNHIALNVRDLDLGGSGPMLVPGSRLVVGGGKQGVMHAWNLDALGGFSASDAGALQKFVAGNVELHFDTGMDNPGGVIDLQHLSRSLFNTNLHAGHIMGGPVLWQRPAPAGGSRLYNWSENSELRMYALDESSATPVAVPEMAKSAFVQAGHPGGILSLSANGSARGTGIVWASTYDASGTFHLGLGVTGALIDLVPGVLRAYSAETLESLWTSLDNGNEDRVGTFAKFNPPTVANGRVYLANFDGRVLAYGLRDHHYERPSKFIFDVIQLILADE